MRRLTTTLVLASLLASVCHAQPLPYVFLAEASGPWMTASGKQGGLLDWSGKKLPNPDLAAYVAWEIARTPGAQWVMIDIESIPPSDPRAVEIAQRVAAATDLKVGWYADVGLGSGYEAKWVDKAIDELQAIRALPIDAVMAPCYVRWDKTPEEHAERMRRKLLLAELVSGRQAIPIVSATYDPNRWGGMGDQPLDPEYSAATREVIGDESFVVWITPEGRANLRAARESLEALGWMLGDQ